MPENDDNIQTTADRRSSAGLSGPEIRDIALLVLGFGCVIGFSRMCSLGFVGYLSYEISSSLDAWYVLRSAVQIAVLVVLAFAGRGGWFKLDIKSGAAAATCGIAAAIAYAVDADGALGSIVAVLGGLSAAVLMYAWMLLLCSLRTSHIVLTTLFGLVISGAIVEGTPLLGTDLALVVVVASAFVAGAVLVKVDSNFEYCRPDGAVRAESLREIPWLTVVMVLACGFFATVLYGVAEYLTWLYDWQPNYPVLGAAALAAIIGTVVVMTRARDWMHVVWAPLFALFASAVVFSCLPSSAVMPVAVGLMMATVFSAHFLYWMVFPAILSSLKVPRAFLAGILLVFANSSLASLIGDALGSVLPRSMQNLGSVSGLMAIAVAAVFAVTLVLDRRRQEVPAAEAVMLESVEEEVDSEPSDSEEETLSQALRSRLDVLVEQYGLTPRESEVSFYTVQGFSCAYIAEKLVVSNSTVRFHQQNIYRKVDVHSRNELIEFVADMQADSSDESLTR